MKLEIEIGRYFIDVQIQVLVSALDRPTFSRRQLCLSIPYDVGEDHPTAVGLRHHYIVLIKPVMVGLFLDAESILSSFVDGFFEVVSCDIRVNSACSSLPAH